MLRYGGSHTTTGRIVEHKRDGDTLTLRVADNASGFLEVLRLALPEGQAKALDKALTRGDKL